MIDIERLAREACLEEAVSGLFYASKDGLQRFAALVLEEAAKVAASLWRIDGQFTADEFASEIRALKDKT